MDKHKFDQPLANLLINYRKSKKLTQLAVSIELACSQGSISQFERSGLVSAKLHQRIQEYLDVDSVDQNRLNAAYAVLQDDNAFNAVMKYLNHNKVV